MRFPLRLSADLAVNAARRALSGSSGVPGVLPLSIFAESSPSDPSPLSVEQCLDLASRGRSRIVWITNPEPLLHPEPGRIARQIVHAGRRVFLHTNGELLRRRIHEFRPTSALFFALQFEGFGPAHDHRCGVQGRFAAALEGLRVAKLSGFLVCARVSLHTDTELTELTQLRAAIEDLDVDGFFLSLATSASPAFARDSQALARIAPHSQWNRLGRCVNAALCLQAQGMPVREETKALLYPQPPREAAEESAPLT